MLKKTWNDTTKNKAIGVLKRAFNWAVEEGLIKENPLRTMKKPVAKRREVVVTPEPRQQIMDAVRDRAFKQFLTAMSQTGARPVEIAAVTATDVNLEAGVWIMQQLKIAKKIGRPRTIYLTPVMIELCRELVTKYPEGPIFRNLRGEAWIRNAIRIRFRRLRVKLELPKGTVAYCFRHAFVTDCPMTVAVTNAVGAYAVTSSTQCSLRTAKSSHGSVAILPTSRSSPSTTRFAPSFAATRFRP